MEDSEIAKIVSEAIDKYVNTKKLDHMSALFNFEMNELNDSIISYDDRIKIRNLFYKALRIK